MSRAVDVFFSVLLPKSEFISDCGNFRAEFDVDDLVSGDCLRLDDQNSVDAGADQNRSQRGDAVVPRMHKELVGA